MKKSSDGLIWIFVSVVGFCLLLLISIKEKAINDNHESDMKIVFKILSENYDSREMTREIDSLQMLRLERLEKEIILIKSKIK